MNDILRAASCKALGALHFLDDAGATVTGIEIHGGRPLITLDGQPPRFVRGALHKSHTVGDHREHVMVALVQGCRVEWTVRTVRGDAAQERA
jgi:hypothetical protein